jgi:hypothetical protein
MLKLSLAMKPAGSVKALRKALSLLLGAKGRLVVKKGLFPPAVGPAAEQREAAISLFMSSSNDKASVAGRVAVLRRYLNGDWSKAAFEHYCPPGCCSSGDTLAEMRLHLVPALIPHAAPLFNRSKWVGHEMALDWIGLIFAVHSLSDVIGPWCRELSDASKPVCQADFDVDVSVAVEGELGAPGLPAPCPGDDLDDGGIVEGIQDVHELITALAKANFSKIMSERNKVNRAGAATFAKSNPAGLLAIMRIAHAPVLGVLTSSCIWAARDGTKRML